MWKNQQSQIRHIGKMYGHETEIGSKIQSLHENHVGLMLEFNANNVAWSREEYMEHVKDFTKFLMFEVDTIETDYGRGNETRSPPAPIETHFYTDTLLPRMVLNTTLLRMRGYPSFSVLDDEEFTAQYEFDARYKAPPPGAGDEEADAVVEHNTVVSNLLVRPNLALLEQKVQDIYMIQPDAFFANIRTMDEPTFREYQRLQAEAPDDYVFKDEAGVREGIYEEFRANCSKYMVTVLMTDSLVT